MNDLISRQKAIDAIEAKEVDEFGHYREYNVAFNDGLRSAVYSIEDLPSAQKTGDWIDNETSYADDTRQTCTCSVCGRRSYRPLGNFCRWCGANMWKDGD